MSETGDIGNRATGLEIIDAFMLEGVVDTSPTLEAWATIDPITRDREFVLATMAVAYDAAVYSTGRRLRGIETAQDVPIGAAIGLTTGEGLFFAGFAQDHELDDPSKHAEVMAIKHAEELEVDIDGATIASTIEPCPGCLEAIEETGISRVVYGATRRELEAMQVVKPHGLKAADLVKFGRIMNQGLGFEFFQLPYPAVQNACLEPFTPFQRDPQTELITFDPNAARVTRFGDFDRQVNESRAPASGEVPPSQRLERQVVAEQFSEVLLKFYGR